jgi:hypothetical protein
MSRNENEFPRVYVYAPSAAQAEAAIQLSATIASAMVTRASLSWPSAIEGSRYRPGIDRVILVNQRIDAVEPQFRAAFKAIQRNAAMCGFPLDDIEHYELGVVRQSSRA